MARSGFITEADSAKMAQSQTFDAIDRDRSGFLSTQELATHLHQAGKVLSEGELTYLFNCMDRDGSGAIDFEEFGELMLRHQQI